MLFKMVNRFFFRLVIMTLFAVFFSNCIPNNGLTNEITVVTAKPPSIANTDITNIPITGLAPTDFDAVETLALTPTVYIPRVTTAGTTPTPTPPPPVSGELIANNSVVSIFNTIPQSAIDAAKARNVWFYHQSVGEYIWQDGLDCLAGLRNSPESYPQECIDAAQNPDKYDWSNWNWPRWPIAQADGPAKMDQFVQLVPAIPAEYDIIGMKFCYVDGWNQNFEQYRVKMENLEKAYPNKTFIWATGALWGNPSGACNPNAFNSCENISNFNIQVREYAIANDKPLFDIASIESNGGACIVQGYEGLCTEYFGEGDNHPNKIGSIRLAKGFWWLIARLSGWE